MVLGYVLLSVALAATVLANVLFTLSRRGLDQPYARRDPAGT